MCGWVVGVGGRRVRVHYSLVPRPHPTFSRLQCRKREKAWYIFSCQARCIMQPRSLGKASGNICLCLGRWGEVGGGGWRWGEVGGGGERWGEVGRGGERWGEVGGGGGRWGEVGRGGGRWGEVGGGGERWGEVGRGGKRWGEVGGGGGGGGGGGSVRPQGITC